MDRLALSGICPGQSLIVLRILPLGNRILHNHRGPCGTILPVMISAEDPVQLALIQYGAVGAIAIMALLAVRVLFNKITAELEYHRLRADRAEEELRKLNEVVRNEYLGTLARATEAIADALAARRRG